MKKEVDWNVILSKPQNEIPSERFVQFVMRNYRNVGDRSRIRFLDLACGAGANSQYLAKKGFSVVALDQSTKALAILRERMNWERDEAAKNRVQFVCADVCDWEYPDRAFDCVLDHNSLCHVPNPPFLWIWDTLKPGGKFFCVCPAFDTWRGTLEGKGYCRTATADEMREYLRKFSKIEIGRASYPDGAHNIASWIIEATK